MGTFYLMRSQLSYSLPLTVEGQPTVMISQTETQTQDF